MNALEWLKRRHAASEENRRRTKFESVPASQAWGGYVDKPGGQQLMVRQPVARQPEVDNTLTVKDDGTKTLVKKWKDSDIKSWGIGGREGQLVDRLDIQASGIGQRPTVSATGALSPESAPRETWGGDLNLTMPQHPRTRRWIQDPASILNIGNLIKGMGRTFQGVDNRLEDNRIRRLMEYRTTNPYYRTGNPYGMSAVNRNPYSGGRY